MALASEFAQAWAELTQLQRQYVLASLEHTSKADTARALGLNPNTVYKWSPKVDEAISHLQWSLVEAAMEALRSAVVRAALIKVDALDDPDVRTRQAASTEILDRVIGKASMRREELQQEVKQLVVRYVDEGIK